MMLYKYQERVARLMRAGKSIVLQAPTGAGKTRASLWPFLQGWAANRKDMPRKCVYAVPMRVLAKQFTDDTQELVYERLLLKEPPVVGIQTGEHSSDPEFTADMTFATIDQVLSGWLMQPYSLSKRKGNLNAGAFVGSYLVFDEFHLFDPDSMLPTTLQMLKALRGISPFILMTATFSQEMLKKLASELGAEAVLLTEEELEEIPAQRKVRSFYCVEGSLIGLQEAREGGLWAANLELVLRYHELQLGAYKRSLVVFNQVERAQRFYQALCEAVPEGVEVRLLHSRFRQVDRQRIEGEIEREFGKEKGKYECESMILVATQVVEVGLDMTCGALHSELAPAASVLQRAGRCARYENEVGKVFVYEVEGYMPYGDREGKAQCERTWQWLSEHQDRHLTFEDEQVLVNYVHTPTDEKIIAGLSAMQSEWDERVQALWRGEGSRAEAARLVRNIRSQRIVVHSTPDELLHRPFAAESFSLHPGTVQGKFDLWMESGQDLEWRALRLVEDEDESEFEGNRPIRYGWNEIHDKAELLGAPLVALNPPLVGYTEDAGLMLYAGAHYECEVPALLKRLPIERFYRLESYDEHIRLVHEAFCEGSLGWLERAGRRIEQVEGWRRGLVVEMAHLVVCLHDLGKLAKGWQGWASKWQKAIGKPHLGGFALAHTDYESEIEQHWKLEKKMKKDRPPHAVESALAALPYLLVMTEGKLEHPLLRTAFTAIARHHAAFTRQSSGYELIGGAMGEVKETSRLLPESLRRRCGTVQIELKLDVAQQLPPHFIRNRLLVAVDDRVSMCCYMLLVRALRHADQRGTELGASMTANL